jgi:hypothetical protein
MQLHKTRLLISGKWLVAFLALTILCGTSHEFIHHFTGAALCGGFGLKTFNSYSLIPGCGGWREIVANLIGPAFTFGLMWWGASLLLSPEERKRRFGLALIFANFPINRLFFVLIRSNDEYWSAYQMFGDSGAVHVATIAIVWMVALPPIVLAFRAIGNSPRWAWFVALFTLPFVFVLLFVGFLELYLLLQQQFLAGRVFGVPWLIVLTEVIALLLYAGLKNHLEGGPKSLAHE